MSQENVEIIRRASEAFSAGELARWLEFFHPDIDWRAMEGALDDVGETHGTEAMRRYVQDWTDDFEGFTVVVEESLEIGGDRVIAVQQVMGRARLSGIETQLRYGCSTPSVTERSCAGGSTKTRTTPSKPWGSGPMDRLSRGSVDSARCWVEGRSMAAGRFPGRHELKCRLVRPCLVRLICEDWLPQDPCSSPGLHSRSRAPPAFQVKGGLPIAPIRGPVERRRDGLP